MIKDIIKLVYKRISEGKNYNLAMKSKIKNKYIIIHAYATEKQFNQKKKVFKKLGFKTDWLKYRYFIKPMVNYLYVDEGGNLTLAVDLEKGMSPLKVKA